VSKYILAGGCDRKYPDYGRRLADFVKKEITSPVVLSCCFSQPIEKRNTKRTDWDVWFAKYFDFAKNIIRAEEEVFFEQAQQSDVIYLHGGETRRLIKALPDFEAVRRAFEEKIVIGSSAGANYLSTLSYSPSKNIVQNGSGILDMGVVVHYGISSFNEKRYSLAQWHSAAKSVKASLGGKPLILLPEGGFTVIDQE